VKRFDVRLRLGATFCLLAAVLFVVGWQGVHHLRHLDREMQGVIYDHRSEEQLVREAFRLSNLNNRITLSIFLIDDPDEIKRLLVQRAANTERISELIRAIKPRLDTEEEKRLLAAVEAARKPYIESYMQALAKLVDEHQRDEARKMMVGVTLPRIAVYHAAWDAFAQCQADKIERGIKQIKADFVAAQRRLQFLIIMAGLITVAIAVYVTFRVTREVAERERAEKALRQSYDQLEQRIQQRTTELAQTNQALQAEISERKRTEEQLRVQATALDAAANAIVITDHTGTIQSVNPAFTALTGYTAQEAVGQNPRILKGGNHDEAFYRNLWQTISSGRVWSGELTNRRKDGSLYAEEMTITPLRNAEGVIGRYIAIQQDITERKEIEAQMERLRTEHALILNSLGEGVHWIDDDGRIKFENPAAAKMLGYEVSELIGKLAHPTMHHTRDDGAAYPQSECFIYATLRDGVVRRVTDEVFWRKDGSSFAVEYVCTPVYDKNGRSGGSVVIFTDITERKRLEAQLFQSQKMETVGKLAGGFAHEFNSLLTAIIGQSELLLGDLPAGSPLAENANEISQAAGRAATLTRQLLAYGRKQFLQPETLDLNRLIASMEGMFYLLMGGEVDTQIVPAAGLKAVKADAGQIEQVIVNMAINARDAMPNGGKLTLETANVSIDQESVGRYPELKPGDYVMLAITDTGTGMSEEVKARVFEPFFTTKGVGQGTGLGLSTCYGIIKQSGGHISVYSEPGRGTTFKMYMPQVEQQTKIPLQRLDSPDLPRGTETILLVEDDPALREMAATLLRRLGYTVLAAANGIEALSLKQQRDIGHIDLLSTDVVMPHMSGKELADRVRALYPHTRILFTSAYTENAIVHQGVLNKGVTLLQKPFTPSALAHTVREVLDQLNASKPDAAQRTFGFTSISDEVKTPGN
jgi:PAS domain S-box-containing protein